MTDQRDDRGFLEGRSDRRKFVKRSAAGVLGLSAAGGVLGRAEAATYAGNSATSAAALALARKYKGKTINFQVEAGLQAALWKSKVKANWEKLTGTRLNIIEVPYPQQFQKALAAVQAGGGIDCLYCQYNWLPDFTSGGVIEQLDPYFDKYLGSAAARKERKDIVPQAALVETSWNGKTWGYPIDGPEFTLFYRTDILGNPKLRTEFRRKHKVELGVPKTWAQYEAVGSFITDKMAPTVYGAVHQGQEGQAVYWWLQAYNSPLAGNNRYFDANMNPVINGPAGVKTLSMLNDFYQFAPPGSKKWGPVEVWGGFLKGDVAMTVTWPPLGRLSAGYGSTSPLLSFVPPSKVRNKFASAIPPGGNSHGSTGYNLAVFSSSNVKELAFAFITWATAPDTYLDLVSTPYSLLKACRYSVIHSARSRNLWKNAGQYYDTMLADQKAMTPDPKILSSQEYIVAIDEAVTGAYAGKSAKPALDEAASKWNSVTSRVGKDKQKDAYAAFQAEVKRLKALRA